MDLLARDPDLDAVFAASDPMALGAMRELRQRRRRVEVVADPVVILDTRLVVRESA
jgi:ABC-type sugar transport system substrate-binding protein